MPKAQLLLDDPDGAIGISQSLQPDTWALETLLRNSAERPRIIFVNRFFYPDVSATSQMLWDITQRLVRLGADVHVICSRQLYEDPNADLPVRETIKGIHIHRVMSARFGRTCLFGRALDYASFYFTSALMMLKLTRPADMLVVKTDPPLLSIVGAGVSAVRGATLVNWLQDVFPEVATKLDTALVPKALESLLQWARDWSMNRAALNIVLGSSMRDYFVARGIPSRRMRIVENWADGRTIYPKAAQESELRSRLSLQDRFVVEYSGNLGRAHEFDTILDAADRLRDDPAFMFLMIGGGTNMHRLEQRVREKALQNFRFLPYQPREALSDSLAAGDVHLACLLPALEGFIVPSKIYGILAAGRPTIFVGDANGEAARMLREGDCGVGIARGDGERLAHELRALRNDSLRTQLMGQRARALFEERYTLDRATQKWASVLDTSLARPNKSRSLSIARR